MEFVMERYLEEFIEENFYKIDFGAKLELYQDEENNGRQYSTLVGNIDLLAMDRNKKKFVIIELKKGKSNDVVVGQILRIFVFVVSYYHLLSFILFLLFDDTVFHVLIEDFFR